MALKKADRRHSIEIPQTYPRAEMLVGGEWRPAKAYVDVIDPYRHEVIGESPQSDADDLEAALLAATQARAVVAATPAYVRKQVLHRVADLLSTRIDPIAMVMTRETGKAIKDSRAEIVRSIETIQLSAEEAIRIEGQQVPIDGSAMGAGKLAVTWRFPVGVVAGITPFNAPFNLACHKFAPALAAGNSVILKAPPQAALVVNELSKLLVDAELPTGWVNVLYGKAVGPLLVRDPRVDFISFTGSTAVGESIKANCGLKRVTLELGGTGPTIIYEDADVPESARICAANGMRLAGQSCLSVQNIFAHATVYDEVVASLVAAVRQLRCGDPAEPDTDVGTVIDEDSALRIESWLEEAVQNGARVLTGGIRRGAQIEPTVIVEAESRLKVSREEIFGPVVVVHRFDDIKAVFAELNSGCYGLHCGIFTKNLYAAFDAIRAVRFGGVIVNGSSTWRSDQLPYGGIKASGIGREGPRYAIREMTDERLVLFNL